VTGDWTRYDDVAEEYAGVAARFHGQLARDLVDAVAPPFGSRVLDLGAGSGVAAAAAAEATGTDGRVVALDPSLPLLRHARSPEVAAVAGAAPDLPFGPHTFDVAVASLVLGHLADPDAALADLVRVLRPGGRLGLTTWGRPDDTDDDLDDADERAAYAVWAEVVGREVDLAAIDEAVAAALPGEERFTEPAHLRSALAGADLRVVDCFGRVYRASCSHAEWLHRVDTGARTRAVRAGVGPERHRELRAAVAAALVAGGVPDPFLVHDEVLLTVAMTRPGRGGAP